MNASRRKYFYGFLLLSATSVVLWTSFSWSFFPVQADETNLAWVAKEVSLGRIPYVDFFTFLPPGVLYSLSEFFKVFGTSLASLRALTVLVLILTTLFLYLLFMKNGLSAGWSAAAAFSIPSLYVPFWPVPSHHWFAIAFGLAGLLAVQGEKSSRLRWLVGGLLVGMSGMCLQTEGAFFTLYTAAVLMFGNHGDKKKKALFYFSGVVIPIAFFASILAVNGALGGAFYDMVKWPVMYYKQAGGFNDVNPFTFLAAKVVSDLPKEWMIKAVAPIVLLLSALVVPAAALFAPAFSPEWVSASGRTTGRWIISTFGFFLIITIYLNGRADWTHLCLWTPLLLLLLVKAIDWRGERWRPRFFKTWVAVVLLIACVRWPAVWFDSPPAIHGIIAIDAEVQEHSLPKLVDVIPEARAKKASILYLGKAGSTLYFYWAPHPPPMDWIMPPSARYNSFREYRRLSGFARLCRVPYIVVPGKQISAFMNQPSPISALLKGSYEPYMKTRWGIVLKRRENIGAP